MQTREIIHFVRKNVEPLPPIPPWGKRYRVSATLRDGLYLPCVVLEDAKPSPALNTINCSDIREIGISPFAIPLALARSVNGETCMAATVFYAVMRDGSEFCFATSYSVEFFEMPEGYRVEDIQALIPAIRGENRRCERIYRDRPFFTCYVDGIGVA